MRLAWTRAPWIGCGQALPAGGHHERLVLVPMNRIGTICQQRVHVVLVAAAGNQAVTRPSMSALTFQNSRARAASPAWGLVLAIFFFS